MRIDPNNKTGREIREMFDGVAPRYDLLNRLLSAGRDQFWRKTAVAESLAGLNGEVQVLDVCCGTGDLALAFRQDSRVGRVVGVDFASVMLAKARVKGGAVQRNWAIGDALHLPFRDGQFDVVSIAFGLRNLIDPEQGIRELARVLRPEGRLVILEFFKPKNGVLAGAYRFYFQRVLPRVGRWISAGRSHDAYRYLPESVTNFASKDTVEHWLRRAGFEGVERRDLTLGACTMLLAQTRRPAKRGMSAAFVNSNISENNSRSPVVATTEKNAGLAGMDEPEFRS